MSAKQQHIQTVETWYQRTCRLRAIWQDNNQPEKIKQKAFRLWMIMFERILFSAKKLNEAQHAQK
jgi:hypothetical protein